jgi:hypothetical protein
MSRRDHSRINPKTNFSKGVYPLRNKSKYIGDKPPYFRSSWEREYMRYLDEHEFVARWGSECISIPYFDPVKNIKRNYFTDFLVVLKDRRRIVVEIKPSSQTKPPRKSKNKKKSTILYEEKMYSTNQSKWAYAKKYCDARGWEFKIITEKNFNF